MLHTVYRCCNLHLRVAQIGDSNRPIQIYTAAQPQIGHDQRAAEKEWKKGQALNQAESRVKKGRLAWLHRIFLSRASCLSIDAVFQRQLTNKGSVWE